MSKSESVKRDFQGMEVRRLRAVELFCEGCSKAEVAKRLMVSAASSGRWYNLWKSHGADGLRKAERPGRKPKVTTEQLQEIQRALSVGDDSIQHYGVRFTTRRVDLLIQRLTGASYHPESVARILRKLGWRWYRRPARVSKSGRCELSAAEAV